MTDSDDHAASTLLAEDWRILRSAEGRFSVHPCARPIPAGWHDSGLSGPREAMIARLDATWADPRPAPLARAMEEGRLSSRLAPPDGRERLIEAFAAAEAAR